MFNVKNILTVLLVVAIAMAGVPVQAGQDCCAGATTHQMIKDCKDCITKTDQGQHNNKQPCNGVDCAVGCASISSLNVPADVKIVLPLSTASVPSYESGSVVVSYSLQTQERPPKTLS